MPDVIGKLIEFLLKERRGRVGFLVYVAVCAAVWLIYDLDPDQEPLTRSEVVGMALVLLVTVFSGVLLWSHFANRREKRRAKRREAP